MNAADREEQVRRARSGDKAAFAELVNAYQRRVLGLLLALSPDRGLAEELAQETFVRAWLSLKKLKNPADFGPWLFGIARNAWREWAKDAKRRRRLPEPKTFEKSEIVRRKEVLHRQIFSIVQDLPDPYGELLSMRYFSGASCREIAEVLGKPIGTVTKQISRAHAMVADQLKALRGFTTLLHFMIPKEAPDES